LADDESAKNPLISKNDIKQLRRLHQKKYRDAEKLFIVEGEKGVGEALSSAADVRAVYATSELSDSFAAICGSTSLVEIDAKSMAAISQQSTPSGILAVVKQANHLVDVEALAHGLTLVLDGVRDPGNLGTLIRIADWFGIDRLLLSPDCVEIYNPKVVQSTMGGIFRVKMMIGELSSTLGPLADKGLPILSAAMGGKPPQTMTPPTDGLLVLGNESKGISAEILSLSSETIGIQGGGSAESLNVAVAGGILVNWLAGY